MLTFLFSFWLRPWRRLRLRDGRPVSVREITPADRAAMASFLAGLSPQARQRRFHGAIGDVPAALLDRLTRQGEAGGRALMATVRAAGRDVMIGEARYAAADGDASGNTAEFAIAVAGEAAGQGLGRVLLDRLLREAAAAGYARVRGDVLADNVPMLRVAESLGFATCRHPDDARLLRVVRRVSALAPAATAARPRRDASATVRSSA